jgi:hypothetical protein
MWFHQGKDLLCDKGSRVSVSVSHLMFY